MSSSNSNKSGGIGFLSLLTLLFIGLKLANVITWSWWLVLMPTIAPIALVVVILLIWLAIK